MTPRDTRLPPLDEARLRLESWAWRAFSALGPVVGMEPAKTLVDAFLCEGIGRRIDQVAPEGFENGLCPAYAELREFFLRFAPEVASYLPRQRVRPASMERLREIQKALCRQIASDHPATLGRFGRTILSRDWKRLEETLPDLERAIEAIAVVPGGEALMNECRAELEATLDECLCDVRDAKGLFDLRGALRRTIARRAPGEEPS